MRGDPAVHAGELGSGPHPGHLHGGVRRAAARGAPRPPPQGAAAPPARALGSPSRQNARSPRGRARRHRPPGARPPKPRPHPPEGSVPRVGACSRADPSLERPARAHSTAGGMLHHQTTRTTAQQARRVRAPRARAQQRRAGRAGHGRASVRYECGAAGRAHRIPRGGAGGHARRRRRPAAEGKRTHARQGMPGEGEAAGVALAAALRGGDGESGHTALPAVLSYHRPHSTARGMSHHEVGVISYAK